MSFLSSHNHLNSASSSGASFFAWQRRARNASDWWWTARDHGKGTDGRSPSRLPLRAHRREMSGYEADLNCCCFEPPHALNLDFKSLYLLSFSVVLTEVLVSRGIVMSMRRQVACVASVFRASSWREVGTRAKKKEMTGEGEGKEGILLSPPHPPSTFFFCSRSKFRAITRLETLATQARRQVLSFLFFSRCLGQSANILSRQGLV